MYASRGHRRRKKKGIFNYLKTDIRQLLTMLWTKTMTNKRMYRKVQTRTVSPHQKETMIFWTHHKEALRIISANSSLLQEDQGQGRPMISWINNTLNWTGLAGASLMNELHDWAMRVH